MHSDQGSLEFFPHDGFAVLRVDGVLDILVHFNLYLVKCNFATSRTRSQRHACRFRRKVVFKQRETFLFPSMGNSHLI